MTAEDTAASMSRALSPKDCGLIARGLHDLFVGSHDAAFIYTNRDGERRTRSGAQLDLAAVTYHVLGLPNKRIGWIPFAHAGSELVAWACIDVDTKSDKWSLDDAQTRELILRIDDDCKAGGITVTWERSKSLGWHGWIFLGSYVPAVQVRAALLTTLHRTGYPVQPFPQDLVCPRSDYAPNCGNGTWAPLFDARSESPACKFINPGTGETLPALDTVRWIHGHRTPAGAFTPFRGLVLDQFRSARHAGPEGEIAEALDAFKMAGLELQVNNAGPGKARVRCPFHASKSGDSAFVTGEGWLHCTAPGCEGHAGVHYTDLPGYHEGLAAMQQRIREERARPGLPNTTT